MTDRYSLKQQCLLLLILQMYEPFCLLNNWILSIIIHIFYIVDNYKSVIDEKYFHISKRYDKIGKLFSMYFGIVSKDTSSLFKTTGSNISGVTKILTIKFSYFLCIELQTVFTKKIFSNFEDIWELSNINSERLLSSMALQLWHIKWHCAVL